MKTILRTIVVQFATVCVLSMCRAQTYSLKDLGVLPGKSGSQANYIGNDGTVVGESGVQGFVWTSSTGIQQVPGFPGDERFQPQNVNNSGTIAGTAIGQGHQEAALYSRNTGSYRFYDFGGRASEARDVNDNLHVAGSAYNPTDQNYDSFIWSPTTGLKTLSRLDPRHGNQVLALNNHDVAVGRSGSDAGSTTVIWSADNVVSQLGHPDGQIQADPTDINDGGFVCGSSFSPEKGNLGFLRDPNGNFVTIANPAWSIGSTIAIGLNSSNQIAGWAVDRPNHNAGITWSLQGGTKILNNVVDSSGIGYDIVWASGINDQGQIAGAAINSAGAARAILLTPVVPEPSSWLVLALCPLLVRKRR